MQTEKKKVVTTKIVLAAIFAALLSVIIAAFSLQPVTAKHSVLAHNGYAREYDGYITEYTVELVAQDSDASWAEATVRFYDKNGTLLETQTGEFYYNYETVSQKLSAYFYVHGEVASYEIVDDCYYTETESPLFTIGVLCTPLCFIALIFLVAALIGVKTCSYTCGDRKVIVYIGLFHHYARVGEEIFDGTINWLTGVWQMKHTFDNGDELFVSLSGLNHLSLAFNGFVYESDEELAKYAADTQFIAQTEMQAEEPAIEPKESADEEIFFEGAPKTDEKPQKRAMPTAILAPDAETKKIRKSRLLRGLIPGGIVLLGIAICLLSAIPAKGVTITESRGYINKEYVQSAGETQIVRTEYEVELTFSEQVDGGDVTLAFYDEKGNFLGSVTDSVIDQEFEGVYVIEGKVASFRVESYQVGKGTWLIIVGAVLAVVSLEFGIPLFVLSLMHKTKKFAYGEKEIVVYARNSFRYVKINGVKYYEDNTVRFGEKHIRIPLEDGELLQVTLSGVNNVSAKVGETQLSEKK